MLRFLSDTAIPPTSNQAERDLRPSKTQQKISGRLRSEKTTRDRYAIRGYASTAIRDALAGNPWMPPIPASASTTPGTRHAWPLRNYNHAARRECLPGAAALLDPFPGSSWLKGIGSSMEYGP